MRQDESQTAVWLTAMPPHGVNGAPRIDQRVAVGGRPASLATARDNVWVAVDNP